MALVQKERINKLTGLKVTRVYPMEILANNDLQFAHDEWNLAQLQARALPLVLKNLAAHLNDPASQGRPIALTGSHILAGLPIDPNTGAIIGDRSGGIYSKVSGMVDTVLLTVEFAEAVSGRWIVAKYDDLLIFFRVGLDFDTSMDELLESGTIYTPPKNVKKKGK